MARWSQGRPPVGGLEEAPWAAKCHRGLNARAQGAAGWLPRMLPVATPRELEALRVGAAGSPVPPGPLAAASVPGPQRGRTRSTSVTAQDCGRRRMTCGPRLVAQASLLHSRAPGRGRRGAAGAGSACQASPPLRSSVRWETPFAGVSSAQLN